MRIHFVRSVVLASLLTLLTAVSVSADATEAGAEGAFGQPITVEAATPIAAILAAPDDFDGRTVRVEGEVRGVCPKAGCWIEIADADHLELRIKVDDGVIVFPQDAVGHSAVAQGTVSVQEMSREKYLGWKRHLAEELGEEFDEASIGDGPYRLVQIRGTGAEID